MRNEKRMIVIQRIIIFMASIILLYFIISLYFVNHYFFHTEINGVNVSFKTHNTADRAIISYLNRYELLLMERNGNTEQITGQEIGLKYQDKEEVADILRSQKPYQWLRFLIKHRTYEIDHLYIYDNNKLKEKIKGLDCINKDIIEPHNVSFQYSNGSYEVIEAEFGNKVNIDRLYKEVRMSLQRGNIVLDLDQNLCYVEPRYTLASPKTIAVKNLLNIQVSANVTYLFGNRKEKLDGSVINQWLSVNDDLEIELNKKEVLQYIKGLAKKYDTVGVTRNFKTSEGKIVEVKGGLYGWKINQAAEVIILTGIINQGKTIEREPNYSQKAFSHDENDIGNTYVEISITKQHLWFYKEGKLIAQGSVVTGNPNNGNATVLGTYMINYKEKGSSLTGRNYDVKVSYWMPFYGNIGIHDAKWRSSFGKNIYQTNGTHGCVNAPFYLAKIIFENIEEGTPVICYME